MQNPECTVTNCDRPTQNYLCNPCTDELQEHLDQIPELEPTLTLIARGEEQPFTHTAAVTHTAAGPRTPLNVTAFADLQDMAKLRDTSAQPYATNPDGARHKHHIETLIKRAHHMVNGDTENKPTLDYINYRLNELHPLPVPHLTRWFADELGITISANRLYKWAQRGIIKPTRENAHPTYHPAAVYVAYVKRHDRNTESHERRDR